MRLTEDDRRELERRYRTPQDIKRGIVTCEALAATCVDRKQLLGVIYWQGCAAFLRNLAQQRAQPATAAASHSHGTLPVTQATRPVRKRHAAETPGRHDAQVGTARTVLPWRWRRI